MREQLARAFGVISLLVAPTALANDGLLYQQRKGVVDGEVHGTGLFNDLAITDVVSGARCSDRNKIRDHTLARLYTFFRGRGYGALATRPGSTARYTAAVRSADKGLGDPTSPP